MADSYTRALASKYYRQLTGGRTTSASARGVDYGALVGTAPLPTAPQSQSFLQKLGDPTSTPGKIIDILSQPLYAGTETMKAQGTALANFISDQDKSVGDVGNLLKTLATENVATNLGSRNRKETPSAALRGDANFMNDLMQRAGSKRTYKEDVGPLAANENDNWAQKAAKFTGGLAADIAFDPLTYVPGAAISKPLSAGAKAASGGLRRVAAEGSTLERLLNDAEKFGTKLKGQQTKPVTGSIEDAQNVGRAGTVDNIAAPKQIDVVQDLIERQRLAPPSRQITDGVEAMPQTARSTIDDAIEGVGEEVPGNLTGRQARMLRNKETGEVVPYSARTAAKEVVAPKYPGVKITDLFYQGKPRIPETPSSTRSIAQIAESGAATPKFSFDDWVRANNDVVLDGKTVAQHLVENNQPIIQAAFRKSVKAGRLDIKVARQAAAKTLTFEQYVNAAKAAGKETAVRYLKLKATPKAMRATPQQIQELASLENTLKTGFEQYRARALATATDQPTLAARAPRQTRSVAVSRALEAARASRTRDAARASQRRLSGAALRSWAARHAQILDLEDLTKLLAAPNAAAFNRARAAILKPRKTGEKQWEEFFIDVLQAEPVEDIAQQVLSGNGVDNVFDAAKAGLDTAAEQVARAPVKLSPQAQATYDLIQSGAGLTPTQRNALEGVIDNQLWREINPQGEFNLETARQATRRNAENIGEGFGRNREAYNAPAQMHMVKNILEQHAAATRQLREGGDMIAASRGIEKIVMSELQRIEDFLFANGIYGTGSKGKAGMPLYLSQIIRAVEQSRIGRDLINTRVFDAIGRPIPGYAARGTVDLDALLRIGDTIANTVTRQVDNADDLIKNIEEASSKIAESIRKDPEFIRRAVVGENLLPDGTKTVRGVGSYSKKAGGRAAVSAKDAEVVIQQVTDAFTDPRVIHTLLQFVHDNSAAAGIQFGRHVAELSEEAIQRIVRIVDDTTGVANAADKVESLLYPRSVMQQLRKISKTRYTTAEVKASDQVATETLTEVIPEIDFQNARFADRAFKAGETATSPSRAFGMEKYVVNAKAALEEVPVADRLLDDVATDVAMQTGVFKSLDFLARKFVAHYGNSTVHEAMTRSGSVGGILGRAYRRELTATNELARKIAAGRGGQATSKSVLREAWDVIRQGNYDEVGQEMGTLVMQLRQEMDYLFATPRGGREPQSMLSQFFREGFDLEHINWKMGNPRFGLPESARFEVKVPGAKPGKMRNATIQELSEQWKNWKIEDPIDFLARMERVAVELATETSISREFYRLASTRGLASTKHRPGFVEVTRDLDEGKSIVARYLPVGANGKSYVHKDLMPELRRMDELLQKGSTDSGGELQRFIRNNLDPILAMWKSGMTIWRPGHHVRNVVGDMSMAYLVSGVKDPKYYLRSLKMVVGKQNALGRRLRGSYGVWDANAALQGVEQTLGSKGLIDELERLGGATGKPLTSESVAKVSLNGKQVDLDAPTIYQALMDRGVLPDFRRQEDIIDLAGDADAAITHRISKTTGFDGSTAQRGFRRAHNAMGNFTEGRDDFIRLAHSLHLLENGIDGRKFTGSLNDVFDAVAARIRKTHPDGTDLTPTERNTMRRLFPFYSWTRKAIPLVLENMVTHPGRFLVYPKASYNFGEAMGVDLESMSDPFPEDSIFPSFITDKMTGVQWEDSNGHYWSVDPGVVQADVLNDFFTNPIEGVGSMLNPAIKTPIEMATGTSLSTRAPISDMSDYIDQQIPGINSINSVTGISTSGTLHNLITGDATLERNRSVEKGYRGGLGENPEYGVNYLTGLRFLDTTKPNYQTRAQFELRDRIAKERERLSDG